MLIYMGKLVPSSMKRQNLQVLLLYKRDWKRFAVWIATINYNIWSRWAKSHLFFFLQSIFFFFFFENS